jgi:hypothetical protein
MAYNSAFGLREVTVYHGEQLKLKTLAHLDENNTVTGYDMTLRIINAISKCIVFDGYEIDTIVAIIPSDLILKLNGHYYFDIIHVDTTTGETIIDRTKVIVKEH